MHTRISYCKHIHKTKVNNLLLTHLLTVNKIIVIAYMLYSHEEICLGSSQMLSLWWIPL